MLSIRKLAFASVAALSLGLSATAASAVTALSPGASSFSEVWSIDGAGMDSGGFSLTVGAGDVATVIYSIEDCCLVGDTYDPVVNGSTGAWDIEGFTGAGGHFEGTLTTVLGVGFHTFDALIDTSGSDFVLPAGAEVSFDVRIASAVPLPAALPLMAAGLGAFGFIGWRRQKS